jgi:hypothetical protein
MEVALESVFPPSHAVLRRWKDARTLEAEGVKKNFTPDLEKPQHDLIAIFRTAHRLLQDGHVRSFADTVRAETIMQCLNQAETLLAAKHTVPAMVLAGGALETHLHNLCVRFGLSWSGDGSIGKYKQALDQGRNQGKQGLVTSSDTSLIESWGKDRNTAAHTPTAFTASQEQVGLTIDGIRQFIARTE